MENNFYLFLNAMENNKTIFDTPLANPITFTADDPYEVGLKNVVIPNKFPNFKWNYEISVGKADWDNKTILTQHPVINRQSNGFLTPKDLVNVFQKNIKSIHNQITGEHKDELRYDSTTKAFSILNYHSDSVFIFKDKDSLKLFGLRESDMIPLTYQGDVEAYCYGIYRPSGVPEGQPYLHYLPCSVNFASEAMFISGNMIDQQIHKSKHLNTYLELLRPCEANDMGETLNWDIANPNYIKVKPGSYTQFLMYLCNDEGVRIGLPSTGQRYCHGTLHFRRINSSPAP